MIHFKYIVQIFYVQSGTLTFNGNISFKNDIIIFFSYKTSKLRKKN